MGDHQKLEKSYLLFIQTNSNVTNLKYCPISNQLFLSESGTIEDEFQESHPYLEHWFIFPGYLQNTTYL